ncbi:Hypothetical protein CAP_7011 [Chondromyces apiculatus DSM 436]|uniref:Uncharacterized protein n=1 Tax=Chondromyces apiculatus DSM 436 TaxID=1192034 RepID=A0A017TFG9_9BACT|nr:Hypothetical protein CAP_7011 [Chondromyces apiculatus DSM 436]
MSLCRRPGPRRLGALRGHFSRLSGRLPGCRPRLARSRCSGRLPGGTRCPAPGSLLRGLPGRFSGLLGRHRRAFTGTRSCSASGLW